MTISAWQRAASFAARVHDGQRRGDGRTPYFAHCARVAMIVAQKFGCDDESAIAAAYLHDAIEDTLADYDEIRAEFGKTVAALVSALTKNKSLEESRREREYDRNLAKADWRARLIKLADALDNWQDASTSRKRAKSVQRCSRAIELARIDAGKHPETAEAIRIVESAIRHQKR